jgi:hypothetical protein
VASSFLDKQPSSRQGVTQTISLSTSSQAASNVLGGATYQVRLAADFPCNYAIGTSTATASTTSPFLPAGVLLFETVNPGQSVFAIKAAIEGIVTTSTGSAGGGSFWVTELS